MRRFAAALISIAIAGCGAEGDYVAWGTDAGEFEASAEFDEAAARAEAEEEVAPEGYDGPCTIDCSGHDAGFEWAADGHDDYGTASSQSFDEGQEAYEEAVEQRVDEKREEFAAQDEDWDYAY